MQEHRLGSLKQVELRSLRQDELEWLSARRRGLLRKRILGHGLLWGITAVPLLLSSPLFFGTSGHWRSGLVLVAVLGCLPSLLGMKILNDSGAGWRLLKSLRPDSKARVYTGRISRETSPNLTVAQLLRRGVLARDSDADQTITVLADSGLVLEANGTRCEGHVAALGGSVSATPKLQYVVPFFRDQVELDGEQRERSFSARPLQTTEIKELKAHIVGLLLVGVPSAVLLSVLLGGLIFVCLLLASGDFGGTGERLRSWGFGARLPIGLAIVFFSLYLERTIQWARLLARDLRVGKCLVAEVSGDERRWENLAASRISWTQADQPAAWRSERPALKLILFLRSRPPVRSFLHPG